MRFDILEIGMLQPAPAPAPAPLAPVKGKTLSNVQCIPPVLVLQ